MKFKSKAWIGWLIFATISWPLLAPRYTHLQSILAIIFSYITVLFIIYVLSSGAGKDIYSHLKEKDEDE
tara:strand:+ start:500 stop:706 length:207 start_codon:yes stop_codon:yes gene_type:complete